MWLELRRRRGAVGQAERQLIKVGKKSGQLARLIEVTRFRCVQMMTHAGPAAPRARPPPPAALPSVLFLWHVTGAPVRRCVNKRSGSRAATKGGDDGQTARHLRPAIEHRDLVPSRRGMEKERDDDDEKGRRRVSGVVVFVVVVAAVVSPKRRVFFVGLRGTGASFSGALGTLFLFFLSLSLAFSFAA